MEICIKFNYVKRLILGVIFVHIMLCVGCRSKNHISNEINVKDMKGIDYVSISNNDLIDSYSIVKLQTEKSIINNIDQIQIFNDNIYILDKKQSRLLVFNSEGEYIQDVGRKGQGHNEFIAVSSFYINPEKLTVTIVDPMKNIALCYDLAKQGSFINGKEIELEATGTIANMRYIGDGKVICFSNPNMFDDKMLYVVNEDDFSVNYIISKSPFRPNVGAAIIATQPYSIVSGDIHFVSIFEKEIRSYSNHSIKPIILVEDNKDKLNRKELRAIADVNSNDFFSTYLNITKDNIFSPGLQNIFETNRFILCTSLLASSIIWDKYSEQGLIIKPHINSMFNLDNICYSEGNTLISIWTPTQIDHFKRALENGNIKALESAQNVFKIIENYDPNQDNPVVIFFQMKNVME